MGFNSSIDAAINWDGNLVYFFKGNQYIRYIIGEEYPDSVPRPLAKWKFPKPFNRGIDAAINWNGNLVYFFKGNQYIRYIIGEEYPDSDSRPLSNWKFPEPFNRGIDAAINWGGDLVYFFKGNQYIRYKIGEEYPDSSSRPLSNWKFPEPFDEGIDAAINWGGDLVYFFKGNQYIRYKIGEEYPDSSSRPLSNWNLPLPDYKNITAMSLLDVWGEGRLTCYNHVTGFQEAYNINKVNIPSNCHDNPIQNLIYVSDYENPRFDLPDNFVQYITVVGSPITVGTAKEMYRVLNKRKGVVILYCIDKEYIKKFEENMGRLIYKPYDPLNTPFDQIKTSYRIYGFPGVVDHDEL